MYIRMGDTISKEYMDTEQFDSRYMHIQYVLKVVPVFTILDLW
jgi:hypothetical protein